MYQRIITEDLRRAIRKITQSPIVDKLDIVCTITENPGFGDYTTNVPLQLAKLDLPNRYHSTHEIANEILEKLGHPDYLENIEIAGPGFINFFLKTESLIKSFSKPIGKTSHTASVDRKYLVEFAHPNTHKTFHIGHFRNISIGESISRLLEYQGHQVFRVTYGGDIGPHVAKALWGIEQLKDEYERVKSESLRERAKFLGKAYALGSQKFESDPKVKEYINEINQRLYARDPEILPVWEETKKWSIAYFDSIYNRLGTEFEVEIWESEIEGIGKRVVEENLGKVFVEDQGAIIFPGERYGLHNRVFLTSKGYPTYEAKELGLTQREEELFPFDKSLHIVANEQAGFFRVVIKALELIEQKRKDKKHHVAYGMVNLASGKMSSRKGEVITAEELIDQVSQEAASIAGESRLPSKLESLDKIAIAAIKFAFLKYSLSKDIAFDIKESVSLQGDSGIYLLYTYARARSVLEKGKNEYKDLKKLNGISIKVEDEERSLLRQLEYFDGIVEKASSSLEPNILCYYLLDLAKAFNLFYQKFPILGSKEVALRLALTKKVEETLKEGLRLLGIETLEKM